MRWLYGITDPMGNEFEQAPGVGEDRKAWCAAVCGVTKSETRLPE